MSEDAVQRTPNRAWIGEASGFLGDDVASPSDVWASKQRETRLVVNGLGISNKVHRY